MTITFYIIFISTLLYMSSAYIFSHKAFVISQKTTSIPRHLFGRSEPPKIVPDKNNGGGMFGGMGNMMESLKKAQEMAKQAETINKELEAQVVTGKDPSGMVTCTFNGMTKPIKLEVNDALLSQGAAAVSQATTQAMLDAHKKSQDLMIQRMQEVYAGLGLPIPPM